MARTVTYYSPETPDADGWSESIGDFVRVADMAGVSAEARLGAVATSQLTLDDIDGTVGHDGDHIVGFKQVAISESAAPTGRKRIWTGYTAERAYSRDGYILDAQRRIDVGLADLNAFLSFRRFTPESIDETSSFNRPAETDVARVTALLAVDFLSTTLFDGLVSTLNPVDMDANDYAKSSPADVLNDCAQQSKKNFFVFYDEGGVYTPAAGDFGLFYDFNDSEVYTSDFRVSNVADDVDSLVSITLHGSPGADFVDLSWSLGGNTFAPAMDGKLVRDPGRVVSGLLADYDGGTVYETLPDTAVAFGWRDDTWSTTKVKTATKARARARAQLLENATEDDTIEFSCFLPRAHVNDAYQGERFEVKFSHLPGYEDWRWVRAVNRTVSQIEPDPALAYTVHYECTPLAVIPVASCTTALSARVIGSDTGTSGAGSGASITVSVSATPTSDDPSIVMGFIYNIAGDTPEAHLLADPSGFTFIDGYKGTTGDGSDPDWAHRAFLVTGVYYKAIASASTQTMATTYSKGYGGDRWEAVLAIFQTAATSPVQDASATVLANAVVPTLGTPPTPGNMILAFVDARSANDITATESGWTQIYASEITQPGGDVTRVRNVALFMRCFVDGDGHGASPDGTLWQFGAGGGTVDMFAVLTEWAIT